MPPHPSTQEDLDQEAAEWAPSAAAWRVLPVAVLGPLVTGYATVAALFALVTAMASGAQFATAGVLRAAAPGWLAAYQVPPTVGGHPLGALPLLPTIAALWLVAHTASGAADRLALYSARRAVPAILAIAGAHGLFGTALAELVADGPTTVAPLRALCLPAGLSAAAATVGIARGRGLFDGWRHRLPPFVPAGLRAGLLGLFVLVTAGAMVVVAGLADSAPEVYRMFRRAGGGFGAEFGMLLLSAGYLPNLVVAGSSFLAGPGLSIGAFSVSPAGLVRAPLPGVPLLGALPDRVPGWWPLLLLVPAGIGAFVGWALREVDEDPLVRLRALGVAAALMAAGAAVLGTAAGGRLADGPFDPLTVHPWSFAVAVLAWTALPGALLAWLTGPRPELDFAEGLLADDFPDDDFPDDDLRDGDFPDEGFSGEELFDEDFDEDVDEQAGGDDPDDEEEGPDGDGDDRAG